MGSTGWIDDAFIGRESPLQWLEKQSAYPKIFWKDRSGELEFAAAGAVETISRQGPFSWEGLQAEIDANLQKYPGKKLFGGMAFDPLIKRPAGEWSSFGSCWFILPETIYVQAETANSEAYKPHKATIKARGNIPDVDEWRARVEACLDLCRRKEIDKVVLARRAELLLDSGACPFAILEAAGKNMEGCFHFYLAPTPEEAFFGCSPELLYNRKGSTVITEALAASRPRGLTFEEDNKLRQELFEGSKERLEHSIVVREIKKSLESFCGAVCNRGLLKVLQRAYWQHLYQSIQGILMKDITDIDILESLHPTPAVCGLPRSAAKELIRLTEGFDRGYYAGPIGWIGKENAEFCVGLRSAHWRDSHLTLFSGAGIVNGSIPLAEWHELEVKIAMFEGALNGWV